MKIKVTDMAYDDVMALPKEPHEHPMKQSRFFRWLLKTVSVSDLKATHFTVTREGMEKLDADEPALYLMNHSSFIDLKIAATILYPRPFHVVCTSDGFVGKKALMRRIGCIPARKFIADPMMVRDMNYALKALKSSVLMYPEASYSFDGTATPLPESLGKCLKLLKVPVVMIRTDGAFLRDPLYNNLQLRQVDVSAKMTYLLSPEEISKKSVDELNEILKAQFSFDNFRLQKDNRIRITESFRADGLNRVLYKCPVCQTEGEMEGKGIHLTCRHCGKVWELAETGYLASEGGAIFDHVPDWYAWERQCVKADIENGTYRLDADVTIMMLVDSKSLYRVGEGRLIHTPQGFHLEGCGGKLVVDVPPKATYSLYADYFWYEIGDMICIGDNRALYYCFPKGNSDIAAKTRLAVEELYKRVKMKTDGK